MLNTGSSSAPAPSRPSAVSTTRAPFSGISMRPWLPAGTTTARSARTSPCSTRTT
jgi:hypothetical protein